MCFCSVKHKRPKRNYKSLKKIYVFLAVLLTMSPYISDDLGPECLGLFYRRSVKGCVTRAKAVNE